MILLDYLDVVAQVHSAEYLWRAAGVADAHPWACLGLPPNPACHPVSNAHALEIELELRRTRGRE